MNKNKHWEIEIGYNCDGARVQARNFFEAYKKAQKLLKESAAPKDQKFIRKIELVSEAE